MDSVEPIADWTVAAVAYLTVVDLIVVDSVEPIADLTVADLTV